MKNIRQRNRPRPPYHEDFDWMVSLTPPDRMGNFNPKSWKRYCAKVRHGQYQFGICMWGAVGRIEEVTLEMSGKRFLVRDTSEHGKVREIFEDVDWDEVPNSWLGAPNCLPVDVVDYYERKKQEWITSNQL